MSINNREPTPIELATLEELFAEISRRNSHALLVVADTPRHIPNSTGASMYHTSWISALGLASWADAKLKDPASFINVDSDPTGDE